jgi:L-fucose mutarotase
MINARIIHPVIIGALASAGHGSTILVADAHYAVSTTIGANADVVFLNLESGLPSITRVVELISGMVAIESVSTMRNPNDDSGGIQDEVATLLGSDVPHRRIDREEFYAATRSENLALCIVTGDTRRFGNVLLTIGVTQATGVRPELDKVPTPATANN